MVDGPLPDAGDAVIHGDPDDTVHEQPASVTIPTEVEPALLANDALVGDRENVQGTPACVTVTVFPPMVTVAVRLEVAVFAGIVRVTAPLPVPVAGETATQDAAVDAVHEHPAIAVTLIVALPPSLAMETVVVESEYEQAAAA